MHDTHLSSELIRKTLARAKALTQRGPRDCTGRFWIEGVRQFVQACEAQFQIDTILYSPILLQHGLTEKLMRRQRAGGARLVAVSPEQFRGISRLPRASGIAAVVKQRWTPLNELAGELDGRGHGWLVIERLNSPGNLGTILRTAEATGISGAIFVGRDCDPYDPRVVRASMGGIFHLQLARTSPEQLRRWCDQRSIRCVGLSPNAAQLWTEFRDDKGLAIVLGEERNGLSERLGRICDLSVRLPMAGRADSLNVAVAAGVMMYELMRRRERC